jgi:hypothetical protein
VEDREIITEPLFEVLLVKEPLYSMDEFSIFFLFEVHAQTWAVPLLYKVLLLII